MRSWRNSRQASGSAALAGRAAFAAAPTCLVFLWAAFRLDVAAAKADNPWNVDELKQPPAVHWLCRAGGVHSLMYSGEKFMGRDTEVFAFYASPTTIGEAEAGGKFPGVVLIHGGGGTAFDEWVWLWAKRGYAAIAMDLAGYRPPDPVYAPEGNLVSGTGFQREKRVRLPNGGPDQTAPQRFDSVGGEVFDDWPYHAVANVIRAHSLLRSFAEVDAERTAVTGISWGGYLTCMAASLDDRFKAAVPVYGCGFLHGGESVLKGDIDRLGDRRDLWVQMYDPSTYLPECRVPIFFVNGTNDEFFPLDSWQKSIDRVAGLKQARIEVNMRHGSHAGWAPKEIGLFIDSFCRGGVLLPLLGDIRHEGGAVVIPFTSADPVVAAKLHYTADQGMRTGREWKMLPAHVSGGQVVAPEPPQNANTWFVSLCDHRGAMVTTPVQFTAHE